MLADDVTAWNDGGGQVRAALHPITGRAKVVAFVIGLLSTYTLTDVRIVEVNGQPAARISLGGQDQFLAIEPRNDQVIGGLYAVLNPAKLRHLR